jgi:hypothetical protein
MTEEGIPLWGLIKPKPENRMNEINNLLRFYSSYQDQIESNAESFDLFITELLHAGYDCLISDNWLGTEYTSVEYLGTLGIPKESPLVKLTLLLEEYFQAFKTIDLAKKLVETFPILISTRIGRDLKFSQRWIVERETRLKTDPEKFGLKPLTRDELEESTGFDLPPIIKKHSDLFEKQLSQKKIAPKPSLQEIFSELISSGIEFSDKFSKAANDLPNLSQAANEISRLVKIDTGPMRKRGAGKGIHPSAKKFSQKDEIKITKEYQSVLNCLKEIRSKRNVEKNISWLTKQYGQEYRDQIKNEAYPSQLAFELIQEKYQIGKNKLSEIINKNKNI